MVKVKATFHCPLPELQYCVLNKSRKADTANNCSLYLILLQLVGDHLC